MGANPLKRETRSHHTYEDADGNDGQAAQRTPGFPRLDFPNFPRHRFARLPDATGLIAAISFAVQSDVTRPRVVLAEDHAPVAHQLRAILAPCCDIVKSVADGSALVAAVESLQPDIVVSDIAMPGMSGLAAARIILERNPSARIVFVTIRDEPSMVQTALDCGACGYVLKNDAGDELASAISAVLSGERYVSTSVRPVTEQGSIDGDFDEP